MQNARQPTRIIPKYYLSNGGFLTGVICTQPISNVLTFEDKKIVPGTACINLNTKHPIYGNELQLGWYAPRNTNQKPIHRNNSNYIRTEISLPFIVGKQLLLETLKLAEELNL
jgi:hypothetical protein